MLNYQRYQKNPVLKFPERTWPDKEITKAPIWCSVDLRDGNQALVDPMVVSEKIEMWNLLLKLGFKQIEVGFPAASQIEYDFLRRLVDEKRIPDDVTVQVLAQCRKEQIDRTFESIQGVKRAVVHIYNSTSTLQRDVVFHKNMDEIVDIAVQGTKWVKEAAEKFPGEIILEYSPESFTGTEMDFAVRICDAVADVWQPDENHPMIVNLPSTVEMNTPNVYADQIEYCATHMKCRDRVTLSIHPHNDRGEGVASTELALLAGADRVEGTLLGNGERTGNVDILNVAYNMFSQGIDPKLNLENINEIIEVCERLTKMKVDPRHPYAGKLVFTAFSGSHQDAINKGEQAMKERGSKIWQVPYLPIDPADIGRKYEPVVRINSQSGKGGAAFVMENNFGYALPKAMHPEFGAIVQKETDRLGTELLPSQIFELFDKNYLAVDKTYGLLRHTFTESGVHGEDPVVGFQGALGYKGREIEIQGVGNGPIDAFFNAISDLIIGQFTFVDYSEHAITSGSDSQAVCYIHLKTPDGKDAFGVGKSHNINRASLRAILCAINRAIIAKDGKADH